MMDNVNMFATNRYAYAHLEFTTTRDTDKVIICEWIRPVGNEVIVDKYKIYEITKKEYAIRQIKEQIYY